MACIGELELLVETSLPPLNCVYTYRVRPRIIKHSLRHLLDLYRRMRLWWSMNARFRITWNPQANAERYTTVTNGVEAETSGPEIEQVLPESTVVNFSVTAVNSYGPGPTSTFDFTIPPYDGGGGHPPGPVDGISWEFLGWEP